MRSQMRELEPFQNMDEGSFLEHRYYAPAATRMVQVTLEAVLDLWAHIIAHEGWGVPKSYREVVLVAAEHGLIPAQLRDSCLQMARFRNRLVHLYDDIGDAEVLQFIKDHLGDLRPLVAAVVRKYLGDEAGG